MANRTVSVILQAEIGAYVAGMTKAAIATKGVGETAEASTAKATKGFDLAGRGSMLMGAAVGAALVGIITKSMEFEKSMSAVQAATQASASTMGELRAAAIKAGADTQYSATEAAGAITEMAKAGVSAADIMKGGLSGALNLAAAGQLDVADAAGIASTAMTQFSLSGSDLPHVADLLAAGAGKAMGSVEDMGQALNQAGLLASSTGISIEETTGTLAAFASAGLIGSDAGTSFKSMLQQLQAPSQITAQLMSDLGINAYDAQGNFIGLSALAQQLQTQLGGLTQAQRDQALAQIFGTDAARAATVLYREGAAGIDEWTKKVNDSGYAQKQASQLTDNLSGDLERLGGSFDTLLISMGQGAQGPLRALVQMLGGLVDGVGGIISAFSGLPAPVQVAIGAFGAWAAVGDKVSGTLGKVLEPLKEGASGVIGAFTEALGYAKENGDGLGEVLGSVGETAWDAAKGGLKELAKAVGPELGMAAASYIISDAVGSLIKMATAGDAAAAEIKALNRSLEQMDASGRIDATTSAIEDLNNKLAEARATMAGTGQDLALAAFNPLALGNITAGYKDADASAAHYREEVARLEAQQKTADDSVDVLSQTLGISANEVLNLADKYGVDLTGSLDTVVGRFLLARDTQDQMSGSTQAASSTMQQFSDDMDAVKTAADSAKNATDQFQLSLDILTGKQISLNEVESAYYAALDSAKGALDGLNGRVADSAGNLDLSTEAGRKTNDVLTNLAQTSNQYIATLIQQGTSASDVQAKDAQLRQSFYDTALQMTGSKTAAENLTNSIFGIPAQRTTQINADTQAAQNAIAGVQTSIDNLHGKTVTITMTATGTVAAILGDPSAHSGRVGPAGFSAGGYTGDGGKYQPAGIVHAGEVVFSQDDVAAHGGVGAVEKMRKSRMRGYASGGAVISVDVDDRPYTTTLNTIQKNLEPVTHYTKALEWAMSQSGKPYIWGGVGPGGYDCSGFMSAITNVIRGRSPYSRVGSTANFPWTGFASGNGLFTIGSTPNASGGIGHMAGTLLGVNVESTGDHVRYGAAARGASNGLFTQRAHLAMFNGGVIGEPVVGMGLNTGNSYSFGEKGPEVVLPTSREMSGGGSWGAGGAAPVVNIDGAKLSGTLMVNGLEARMDAVVVRAMTTATGRTQYSAARG